MNKVQLIGRLGADPEVRTFQNGGRVCNFSLATSERWKDKQSGERMERTEWHRIAIFSDPLVDVARNYLFKGSQVYIEGQIETRKWQDQHGNDRWSTEIVLRPYRSSIELLGSKGDNAGSDRAEGHRAQNTEHAAPPQGSASADLDDEIPF